MPDVASPRSWAREVAGKIRAEEAATIDETVEQRAINLTALVRKSLSGIPAGMKGAYLDELDTHFPATPATGASLPATLEKNEAESAAASVNRRLPELSAPQRGELLRKLLNDSFRDSQSGGRLARLLLEGPRKLNVPGTAAPPLDPDRTLRLLEVLCEAVLGLQRLNVELWRTIGARKLSGTPVLASDAEFRASIARCLAGDAEVPATMIEQELERQRRAIAAAMAMLGPFADNYAEAVLKLLAPESISARFAGEAVSMFASREAVYWKQFCHTWETLDHAHFEAVFVECLGKHLRSFNRSTP